MGLNYYPRGRREELDPPNIFVEAALGEMDSQFAHLDEHLVLQYYTDILTETRKKFEELRVGR